MYWATTTFRVKETTPELTDALVAWRDHCRDKHPQIKEIRCYRHSGGTSYIWQEGFENFHDFQDQIEAVDELCERVTERVFRHAVPGFRDAGSGRTGSDLGVWRPKRRPRGG